MVLMRIRAYYSPIAGVINLTFLCSAGMGKHSKYGMDTHKKPYLDSSSLKSFYHDIG